MCHRRSDASARSVEVNPLRRLADEDGGVVAAGELCDTVEAGVAQQGGGSGGAVTTGAVDERWAVRIEVAEPVQQGRERQIDRSVDAPRGEFGRIADIDDLQVGLDGAPFLEIGRSDARRDCEELRSVDELGGEISHGADDVVKADAGETETGFALASGFGNDDDGLAGAQDVARVFGVTAVQADIYRAEQVTGGELVGGPGVDDDRAVSLLPDHEV